jgi:MFS transporter, FHS family, L-fucose permease
MILKKTGFRNGMSVGLLVMSAGAFCFIPAAYAQSYALFLLGLFILGSGLALLQTAANPYVTVLGPIESAAKRISIMGICNKVAGALSPIILGSFLFHEGDSDLSNQELALKVINPYLVLAFVLILLALFVRYSSLPSVQSDLEEESKGQNKSIFSYTNLWFGVLALFVYVGAEVIAGDTIVTYSNSIGIALTDAKVYSSITLVGMIIGYIAGIALIPRFVSQERMLLISSVLGVIFSFCVLFLSGITSVYMVAALGLANAIVWPAIWPMAIKGLGKHTQLGSSFLIMAIAGGAILPLVYGKLADASSLQAAYWILIPCYVLIGAYAIVGTRLAK